MNKKNTTENIPQKEVVISFYKKRTCWYAEVPEHTETQNLMVSGADELCEMMSAGHKRVTVKCIALTTPAHSLRSIIHLDKTEQSAYGATYKITADPSVPILLPETCWLCNVTKTVFKGNHPQCIDILEILPNDGKPYNGEAKAA